MSSSREIITFDPSGDVFLLLETNDDQSHRDQMTPSGYSNIKSPADEAPADEAPAEEAQVDNSAPQTGSNNRLSDYKVAEITATSTREILMRVSSKHLSLASPFFNHMFHSRPRANGASHDQEPVTIPLRKDDLKSLQTLLYIVHGLTRQVPRRVGRDQLLQTVILIDKYEFHEVAEVFTDMWFEPLQPEIPCSLHPDLASWIYICWGLRKSRDFNTLTEIAIRETNCGLEDPDDLVPYWIIGKSSVLRNEKNPCSNHTDEIQSNRRKILTKFLETLSRLLELYGSSDRQCHQNSDCDALALGKLIQGLKSAGLYPLPEPSTLDRSIQDLFLRVRAMDLTAICGKYIKKIQRDWGFSNDKKSYHLEEAIGHSLSGIEDSFRGLNIDEISKTGQTRTQGYASTVAVEQDNLLG